MAKNKKLSREQLDKKIRAIQSVCRLKPGGKSVVQELLEERRAEKEKEDREFKPLEKEIKINWLK